MQKRFNISRSLVSKYLAKARSLGLVEIIIHDDLVHPYRLLEEKLVEKFGLTEVICIAPAAAEMLNKRIGIAAGKYLSRILKVMKLSAFLPGWSFMRRLKFPAKNQWKHRFIPLVGGLGQEHTALQANVVCEIFARKSGGAVLELHAPITVDSAESEKGIHGTVLYQKRV